MRAVLVAIAGAVAIIVAPFPFTVRALALLPLLMALIAVTVEEILIGVARVRAAREAEDRRVEEYDRRFHALPDPEWAQVHEPLERKRLHQVHRVPFQRRAGGAS